MENNNANAGWQEWSKHVLHELKRLNENIEDVKDDIGELKITLTKHDVFIEEAKDKDIIGKVVNNTKFVNNVNKLVWKLVGTAIISAGGITGLVNYLSGAFVK